MDYDFIKACFISACIGWCYVVVLTANRGLFDWIPKYYPPKGIIEKVLRCEWCLSGWLSVGLVTWKVIWLYSPFTIEPYLYILVAPMVTMAMVNIIKNK